MQQLSCWLSTGLREERAGLFSGRRVSQRSAFGTSCNPQVSGATSSQGSAAASSSKAGGSNRAARGGRTRGSGSIFSSSGQGTAYGKGGTAELELAKQVSQEDCSSQQLYQTWGSQPPATASFKLDGSLVIAFVWQGQLYTCTRRRMDSEQVRQTLTLLLAVSFRDAAMAHRVLSRWGTTRYCYCCCLHHVVMHP